MTRVTGCYLSEAMLQPIELFHARTPGRIQLSAAVGRPRILGGAPHRGLRPRQQLRRRDVDGVQAAGVRFPGGVRPPEDRRHRSAERERQGRVRRPRTSPTRPSSPRRRRSWRRSRAPTTSSRSPAPSRARPSRASRSRPGSTSPTPRSSSTESSRTCRSTSVPTSRSSPTTSGATTSASSSPGRCSSRGDRRRLRARRHLRRDHHPADRVRLGARDGPADHDRAVRHRHRLRASCSCSPTSSRCPTFAPQLAAMIGIGVGIDYALFIVTRYRQGLHEGCDPEAAVVTRSTTVGPGRAVRRLHGRDLAARHVPDRHARSSAGSPSAPSLAVLVTMLAVGHAAARDARVRRPQRSTSSRCPAPRRGDLERRRVWYRWSRLRPAPPVAVAVVGLADPRRSWRSRCSRIRLGVVRRRQRPDVRPRPRRAYDLLAEGFGPGLQRPAAASPSELPTRLPRRRCPRSSEAVADDPTAWQFAPPSASNPAARRRRDQRVSRRPRRRTRRRSTLIHRLRDDVLPDGHRGHRARRARRRHHRAVRSTSPTSLGERLPHVHRRSCWCCQLPAADGRCSARSLVPLKAVIMNLLSIGAAYGVIVAVFQWGWGASLVGVGKEGPIEAFVPMMLFAILFGLSMDYEVFLLSPHQGGVRPRPATTRPPWPTGWPRPPGSSPPPPRSWSASSAAFVLRRQPRRQAVRPRPRRRGLHRRHHRPHGARAGHDGAARRPQLVVPEVARAVAAEDPHRGRPERPACAARARTRSGPTTTWSGAGSAL